MSVYVAQLRSVSVFTKFVNFLTIYFLLLKCNCNIASFDYSSIQNTLLCRFVFITKSVTVFYTFPLSFVNPVYGFLEL